MNLAQLVVFTLYVLGATYVVTESSIFAPVRILLGTANPWLQMLLYCPKCVAFWVGLSAPLLALDRVWAFGLSTPAVFVVSAFSGCGIGLLGAHLGALGNVNETETELITFLRAERRRERGLEDSKPTDSKIN